MPGAADRGRTASSTGGPDRDPTWDGWRANWAGITARAPTTTPLQVAQAARATLASAVRGARRPWWRGVEQLTRTLCRSTSRRVEPARGAIRVCWIASWQRMILATTDGCAVLGWLVDRPNPLWSTCLLRGDEPRRNGPLWALSQVGGETSQPNPWRQGCRKGAGHRASQPPPL
jgi:hypothetical protein